MDNTQWNGFFEIEDVCALPDIPYSAEHPYGHLDAVKALADCINTIGRVDLPWMAEASGLSTAELKHGLRGAIFQDPELYALHQNEDDGWCLRSYYISGNIKTKLETAKELNRRYSGRFNLNVLALNQAMPARIKFEDIGISIGSPWIPARYYAEFAQEVLELPETPDIGHYGKLGHWRVVQSPRNRDAFHNVCTYGTSRMTALKIMEHTLNASTPKVYDEVVRPDLKSGFAYVLNKEETLAVQERQEALQQAFKYWIGSSPTRIRHLEDLYYSTFACTVAGRYDGSFLTLPDLSPNFTPHAHQKNALVRIILEPDLLLNHKVGAGKTSTLIMGLHERKRMGLSDKNLAVVPNNVLEAFERTHRELYPNDRILVIRPEHEFLPDCRQQTLEQIRDGDFVAVYMAYSSFEMISMSRRYRLSQKAAEIASLRAMAESSRDPWERRQLETMAGKKSKDLFKMEKELPMDEYLPFDDLGITTLVVDEAHNFKNISIRTRADGVVGMHTGGSNKCNAMLEKTRFVRRNGGGILLATGTPLTNSICDLFVLQHFLQPEQLELLNLGRFDEWIGSFATRQTNFEVDVDSQNFRIMTRFSRFHNLPELISLFSSVCDSYNGDDNLVDLPQCGDYIDTVVPKSQQQADYFEELVYRTELIRAKLVKPHEDNLLKVTNDGRAAALDTRLADPRLVPAPGASKTHACAQNVFRYWKNFPHTAQLVFCDLGTPKKGFNIYDELKHRLVKMGIPEKEIAFVHSANTDARRRKLFQAVNDATVRVLIGSTSKLGTGVNVQERLIAIHHLDVPWKPSDITQREGRMIRQGNRNKQVYRHRYITAGTFDAYSWQILENKQRFIGQFMGGTLAGRDSQDVDEAVLTYAEIKALSVGDPLLKTRIDTSNELERARMRGRQREQDLRKMQQLADTFPGNLKTLGQRRADLVLDRDHYGLHRQERMTRHERLAFGEELLEALADNCARPQERLFDEVYGFRVLLPANMQAEKPHVLLLGTSSIRYPVQMEDAKASGCIQRLENLLNDLDKRIEKVGDAIARCRDELRQAREEIRKGNPHAQEITRLREKLLDIDLELNRRAEQCAV